MHRRYAKIDSNQTEIVKVLRRCGCSVQSLSALGSGVPDLLVARNGKMWLMEVKDGDKSPSRQKLTDDETQWISKWRAPVFVVHSCDEAVFVVAGIGYDAREPAS